MMYTIYIYTYIYACIIYDVDVVVQVMVPGAYYEAHGALRQVCVHASAELVAVAASKVCQHTSTSAMPTH